ncbi:MAG: antitoxin [Oscillospiraceae bacterium]|nr:antitoxin [Oscillospiraceae bacterium]
MGDEMRSEYNITELHPGKNPYAKKLKQQVTMNLNVDTVAYFKALAEQTVSLGTVLVDMFSFPQRGNVAAADPPRGG